MPTLDEIKEQIRSIEAMRDTDYLSQMLWRKEFNSLPDILWKDEVLENVVKGSYNNGTGILCATNKRLIFVDKGMMWGLKVEDFAYDKISSIQCEAGLIFGTLKIFASGNKADIKNIRQDQAIEFGNYVRSKIAGQSEGASISETSDSMTMEEKLSALERLSKLKEQGILSDAELQAEKSKIMG